MYKCKNVINTVAVLPILVSLLVSCGKSPSGSLTELPEESGSGMEEQDSRQRLILAVLTRQACAIQPALEGIKSINLKKITSAALWELTKQEFTIPHDIKFEDEDKDKDKDKDKESDLLKFDDVVKLLKEHGAALEDDPDRVLEAYADCLVNKVDVLSELLGQQVMGPGIYNALLERAAEHGIMKMVELIEVIDKDLDISNPVLVASLRHIVQGSVYGLKSDPIRYLLQKGIPASSLFSISLSNKKGKTTSLIKMTVQYSREHIQFDLLKLLCDRLLDLEEGDVTYAAFSKDLHAIVELCIHSPDRAFDDIGASLIAKWADTILQFHGHRQHRPDDYCCYLNTLYLPSALKQGKVEMVAAIINSSHCLGSFWPYPSSEYIRSNHTENYNIEWIERNITVFHIAVMTLNKELINRCLCQESPNANVRKATINDQDDTYKTPLDYLSFIEQNKAGYDCSGIDSSRIRSMRIKEIRELLKDNGAVHSAQFLLNNVP